MDLIAHGLWAFALFKRFPWQPQAVFFSVLPDVIFGIPAVLHLFKIGRKANYDKIFSKIEPFYRWGHSLFTVLVLFAIASLLSGGFYWPVLAGMGLHILLDVPLHKGGWVQGQAVLYPLSKKRISGKWWWKEEVEGKPWLAAVNYALALLIYFIA